MKGIYNSIAEAIIGIYHSAGTMALKDHLGSLVFGVINPNQPVDLFGPNFQETHFLRWGFRANEIIGNAVNKRYTEEPIVWLISHSSNPLGLTDSARAKYLEFPRHELDDGIARMDLCYLNISGEAAFDVLDRKAKSMGYMAAATPDGAATPEGGVAAPIVDNAAMLKMRADLDTVIARMKKLCEGLQALVDTLGKPQ